MVKILDVGCGTGEFISGLADRVKNAQIHGVDLSDSMVKVAKAKMNGRNVEVKVGDVEELPYENNTFDVITCSHSFHHYPNKSQALKEMHRVLKPDGKVMIIDGCRDVLFGDLIFRIVQIWEKHVYHLLGWQFKAIFSKTGFHEIVQRRFNFVPLLLTVGTARK